MFSVDRTTKESMKIATIIVRILLGLMFVVFGLNGFLHFIPMGDPPKGLAGEFVNALMNTSYIKVVAGLQVAGGLLVLSGRFLPLGLLLLGPVIVNILLFHLFLEPKGLGMALWYLRCPCFFSPDIGALSGQSFGPIRRLPEYTQGLPGPQPSGCINVRTTLVSKTASAFGDKGGVLERSTRWRISPRSD
jgi:uncharacterized membrane protein YphA (DoxX/SURF4 family)